VSLYGYEAKDEAAKNVERLRFSAKLYPPRNFRNPGAFDHAGYSGRKRNRGTRVSQGRGQSRNGRYQGRGACAARDAEAHPSRPNDESLVIKISYGATSALLEGDAEKKTEQQVARESPQADLLKVAHHGSATSTIPELLAAVHPRFAVISVGGMLMGIREGRFWNG
jgi:hypothetical protein